MCECEECGDDGEVGEVEHDPGGGEEVVDGSEGDAVDEVGGRAAEETGGDPGGEFASECGAEGDGGGYGDAERGDHDGGCGWGAGEAEAELVVAERYERAGGVAGGDGGGGEFGGQVDDHDEGQAPSDAPAPAPSAVRHGLFPLGQMEGGTGRSRPTFCLRSVHGWYLPAVSIATNATGPAMSSAVAMMDLMRFMGFTLLLGSCLER